MLSRRPLRRDSGMWDGVTKSRAIEVKDLRRRLIIYLARGCRELLRADVCADESFSPGRPSSMTAQIAYSSAESTLNVFRRGTRKWSLADM